MNATTSTTVTCDVSISVDGFVAGPNQSQQNPLGEGGMLLHEWHIAPQGDDQAVIDEWQRAPGAYIMGRNMFGPDRGDWDLDWHGWWGDEPPYGVPVFVLGHQPREPLAVGRTTFHFVTDGIDAALAAAAEAARGGNVAIAGGASTINQYLAAGHIDQLHLHVAPVLLGTGERLFDGVGRLALKPIEVTGSPGATHIKYAVG
ncbi:MAG: dihydrofolate reductase [Marmoricola sp.]|jgi:dihydrofolate reductase|nr:dihydrofolate reductase [Marmoricola sp.]